MKRVLPAPRVGVGQRRRALGDRYAATVSEVGGSVRAAAHGAHSLAASVNAHASAEARMR